MRETVHKVSFPAMAASLLQSHINHPLFESDMNQRERPSDGHRASTDIMKETESEALLSIQQLDFKELHCSRCLRYSEGDMSLSCDYYCSDGDSSVSLVIEPSLIKTINFFLLVLK